MKRSFKKGSRSVCTLFILLLLFTHPSFSQTDQPPLRIHAKSAVLMDALSGQVLFEQNPRVRMGPASFVKLLTLYVAWDVFRDGHLKMEDGVRVSEKAWKTGGSKMFIKVGERVKVEDLLKGITIVSGNDACVALAEHIAGSEDLFVIEINKKGQHIGLKESQFKNSHGMPARDQYTTASDAAILARHYLQDHPEALTFHSTLEFQYQGIRQQNRNVLLKKNIGVDGLMTGYVEEFGYHLAATAKRDGQRMIAVVMGCNKVHQRNREAQALLEYGFKNFSTVEAVKKDSSYGPQKVVRGKLRQVPLIPAERGWVTVAKGKENSITVTPEIPPSVTAPIQKGQVIGKLVIQSEGNVLKEVDLLSSVEVIKGINLFWPLIGGGIAGLILMGLIIYLRVNRPRKKKF